jgi:hypothetical protein
MGRARGDGGARMTIELPQEDPKSNLIAFDKGKRKGTLEPVRAGYDACRHKSVFVEEAKRQVTCQKCGAILDAFEVLLEFANKQRRWLDELDEWEAMQTSRLADRYDEQWARDHEGIVTPPEDPATRKVWDIFHAYFGDKFCGMYNRQRRKRYGPEWYGKGTNGLTVSLEYARKCLVPKAVSK